MNPPPVSAPDPTVPTPGGRTRPSRRVLVAVAAAVLVVVAAGAVAVAGRGSSSDRATSPVPGASSTASESSPSPAQADATPSSSASGNPSPDRSAVAPVTPGPGPSLSPGTEAAPIPLDAVATVVTGITARIVSVEAVDGTASGAGEIAGPAVRVTVRITNGTEADVGLGSVVTTVTYGADRTPGVELSGPGVVRLPDRVAAGGSVTESVVYGVPLSGRGLVQVGLDVAAGVPIVVFEGAAPTA